MNLNHVPDLAALAMLKSVIREGSFSAAAKEWGISQQAMSQRMRSVEALVGTQIFVRSPQGIVPTEAGHALLPAIDRLLEQADALAHTISAISLARGEHLDIAASQTIAEHLVPGWLMRFKTRTASTRTTSAQAASTRATSTQPAGTGDAGTGDAGPDGGIVGNQGAHTEAAVTAHVGNSRDVVALVRRGAVEVGFIETPTVPSDLSHAQFERDSLVLVVSPRHPWARRSEPLRLEEMAGLPLVLREPGSGTRDTLEQALAQAGLAAPVAALELGTSAAIRSAVAAGIAPTVMSAHSIRDDVALGKLVALEFSDDTLSRPLTALWNGPQHRLSPAARELLALVFARGA